MTSQRDCIDLSADEHSPAPARSASSVFARAGASSVHARAGLLAPVPSSSSATSSSVAASSISLCPSCHGSIPSSQLESHVAQCFSRDVLSSASRSPTIPPRPVSHSPHIPSGRSVSPTSAHLDAIEALLADPAALYRYRSRLQQLETHIHQVLGPVATSATSGQPAIPSRLSRSSTPMLDVPGAQPAAASTSTAPRIPSRRNSRAINDQPMIDLMSDEEKSSAEPPRHFSRASLSTGRAATAAAAAGPPSPVSAARPSSIGFSFSTDPGPSASSSSTAAAGAASPPAWLDGSEEMHEHHQHAHSASSLSAASSSSSSSAAAAASSYAAHSAAQRATDDASMQSDEELVRRMLQEEEQAEAAAKRRRAEQAEADWQALLQLEATCGKCGEVAAGGADALIQICGDARQRKASGNSCAHKICQRCLRDYLQGVLRKLSNPLSPTAASASAASAFSSFGSLSKPASLFTEADLLCPAPNCLSQLEQWQMKRVLSSSDFDLLLSFTLKNSIKHGGHNSAGSRFVSCPNPKCQNSFEAVEGSGDGRVVGAHNTDVGLDGQAMTAAARLHRAKHRFRCNECATIFCGDCSATPYHDGFDCAQWTKYQTAKKCRFCSCSLTAANTASPLVVKEQGLKEHAAAALENFTGAVSAFFGSASSSSAAAASSSSSSSAAAHYAPTLLDVCNSAECLEKRSQSCASSLKCGCPCGGVKNESTHLPCLKEDCPAHTSEVNEDDFCNICYVEGLGAAPAIQLGCGHFFHYACLASKVQRRWPSARITFGFLNCPLCKKELSHPSLKAVLAPMLALKADVAQKAVNRLAFEGMDNDEAFTSPSGRYYGRKAEYALDRFAYYSCYSCKHPYFGGRRQCEEAAMNSEEKFNEKELVCGSCTAGSDAGSCRKHGKEFIDFKCKFCCNIASFYCWGSTHFCADCHRRQESGDYVSRKPVSDLPKCPGGSKCPIGSKHPPAGTEFTLGCAICRPRDGGH